MKTINIASTILKHKLKIKHKNYKFIAFYIFHEFCQYDILTGLKLIVIKK